MFKKISQAYAILSDAKKREQYDQFGAVFPEGQPPPGAGGTGGMAVLIRKDLIFTGGSFGDIFSDLFGAFRGGGKRRRQRTAEPPMQQRGTDIMYPINIGFMDAIRGISTEIHIDRQIPVPFATELEPVPINRCMNVLNVKEPARLSELSVI